MKPRILDFGFWILDWGSTREFTGANPESGGRESEFLFRATRAKSTSAATTTFFQQRSPRARAQSNFQNPKSKIRVNERGYTLAGALTLLAVMSILMAISLPLWSKVKQRDLEDELAFRGNEYVEAIARYHQKFGSYPPDLETLEKLKFIRKLYADPMTKSGKWKALHPEALLQTGAAGTVNVPGSKDNDDGDTEGEGNDNGNTFGQDKDRQDETPGLSDGDEENPDEEEEVESAGPVVGVASRSKKASFKIYNGQSYYNKWVFVYALPQQQQQQQQQQRQQQQQDKGPGDKKNPGKKNNKDPKNIPPVQQDSDDNEDDSSDWEKE